MRRRPSSRCKIARHACRASACLRASRASACVCARAGTEHGDARDRTDGFGEGLGGEQVDRYTAKMRKRLFAKMAADGAVLLKEGQAKATTGLGGAELDIMHYPGPCCVYVRARCGAPSSLEQKARCCTRRSKATLPLRQGPAAKCSHSSAHPHRSLIDGRGRRGGMEQQTL
jgi:hypothetical protein